MPSIETSSTNWVIERLRTHLEESGEGVPLLDALRRAALLSNRYPAEQLPALRVRMTLITTVPALQAHSMLRYAAWRRVIAEWAARRRCEAPDDLAPELIAQAALAASMAAFSRWVHHPAEDLEANIDASYRMLGADFGGEATEAYGGG